MFWAKTPIETLSSVRRSKGDFNRQGSNRLSRLAFQMFNRDWQGVLWRQPFDTIAHVLSHPQEEVMCGEGLLNGLKELDLNEWQLHFICSSESEERQLQKRLSDCEVSLPAHVHFHLGYLSCGFAIVDLRLLLFPMTELTMRYKMRRQKQRATIRSSPLEAFDLSPGETVVHLHNGIGRFIGLEKRLNHLGIVSEFFSIEYAERAKLCVPLNQAHLLTKYVSGGEAAANLSVLGSNKWKKTREQTERAILGYASEILQNQAARAIADGFVFPPDGPELSAFEEEFPFSETEDQLAAIALIKQEMQSTKAMDRLICGDVGYGKTEVAMRAAFKAVVDGKKQVALLVPTTVLAMQHFETFAERMANFPVNIGILSRFSSTKETKKTLEGIEKGSIDIVIGTHRMVSDDVKFKDLGLVMIDEEQRFGVRAKEHLKKIKAGVDCLTLSATPIPRTLYLSLIGARDLSIINTPPQDRLPIKTMIAQADDQTIKNALLRELSRDGQTFVIHHRIESLDAIADRIKKLVPQAKVLVVHGQMSSDAIDRAFHAFKKGEADVLVATTIVENGIDIPNANTILIDQADHYGLATLYQLRGRVGRWNRRAYAYFLVSSQKELPENARNRLQALAEAGGYGGGMRAAMRDLEMRGAGDILGLEQSGHVSSIGFHLYCKLLKRAILVLKGMMPATALETKIEIPVDARLPEDYVNAVSLRMEIYQKFGEAFSIEEVDAVWGEVQDRFGQAPLSAQWLYYLTRLRVLASLRGYTLIKQEKLSLILEKGKEGSVRRVLTPKYRTPQEMESKIIALF